ncbi:hypothetical protein FRC04_002913 [Tulasnella sp. 424]|nr:hypothetical protein FRC04_002913 [Tulasnella sp. 424]
MLSSGGVGLSVSPPLQDPGTPQIFWHEADTRKGARTVVARNILRAIGYHEGGPDDVRSQAALGLAVEA